MLQFIGSQRAGHDLATEQHLMRGGFLGGLAVKNPLPSAGDVGLIPGSGRSPGEGNGSPLQYSCLGNPMDRGVLWTWQRFGHDLVAKQHIADYKSFRRKQR